MSVTDTATLAATFVDPMGTPLTGLRIDWQSDDSSIVTLSRPSMSGTDRSDSLAVQLRARMTARRSGSVAVVAVVTHPGFQRVTAARRVQVRRWTVRKLGVWPDTILVSQSATLELELLDTTLAHDIEVMWRSTSPMLTVFGETPPPFPNREQTLVAKRRARVGACVVGTARVVATARRVGFEAAELQHQITVVPGSPDARSSNPGQVKARHVAGSLSLGRSGVPDPIGVPIIDDGIGARGDLPACESPGAFGGETVPAIMSAFLPGEPVVAA
ncbi:MAG: hypothetical protein ACRDHF_06290 [Tepidiformaceae bacterium]